MQACDGIRLCSMSYAPPCSRSYGNAEACANSEASGRSCPSSSLLHAVVAETNDGAILFVFGDEAAAAAHQKESPAEPELPAQPESKPAEPKPIEQLKAAATSPPAESKSAAEETQVPSVLHPLLDKGDTTGLSV